MRILIFFIFLAGSGLAFSQPTDNYGLPVFGNTYGFGMDTKGGSEGKIIRVTNLKASGLGSLADAIQQEGPRIIVFEVAGIIDLKGQTLQIQNPYITIAGQTAPDPGVTIIKGGISISTHQVIIQHIRVRPGEAGHSKKSGWEIDGINTNKGAYQVIIDHCSVTWATDENISASGPRFDGESPTEWRKNTSHKVLISNCIIAEGLSNSTHSKGEHSKGSLIHDNATEIAIVGNLFASNARRNPYFKGGAQGIVVNNYIYNPGRSIVHYGLISKEWHGHDWIEGKMVVEGNVFEYGPNTQQNISVGNFNGPVELFWRDNILLPSDKDLKVFLFRFKQFWKKNLLIPKQKEIEPTISYTLVNDRPVWPSGFTAIKASKVKQKVLQQAGARPWQRDAIDQRIIQDVISKSARIINSEEDVGGYPIINTVYQPFNEEDWDMKRLIRKKFP